MKLMMIASLTALSSWTLPALAFCLQPDPPRCVRSLDAADESYVFDMCRTQLQRYLRDVNDFNQCIRDEANRTIEQFNCKARRETFCR